MVRVPTHRVPTHPGQLLLSEFLEPLEISQRELADAIDVPHQRINDIVNRRRGLTASIALRLGKYFGTSSSFWLSTQARWDLYHAEREEAPALKRIRRRRVDSHAASG